MPITTWNDSVNDAFRPVATFPTPLYPLGTRRQSDDQTKEYEYIKTTAAGIAIGDLCVADPTDTTGNTLIKSSATGQKTRGIAHVASGAAISHGWVTVRSNSINLLTVNGTTAGAIVSSSAVSAQAATPANTVLHDSSVVSLAGNGGGAPALALASINC